MPDRISELVTKAVRRTRRDGITSTLARTLHLLGRTGLKPLREYRPFRYLNWKLFAQESTFEGQLANDWRQTDDFLEQTARLFAHWGFSPTDFAGQTVVDLGAGSKLRSKYFDDADIVALEPLADKFMREAEWCDLDDAREVYSCGGERNIQGLVEEVDFIMCINVLDHAYSYEQVLDNVADYLKPGGRFLLSVDLHEGEPADHPIELTDELLRDELTDRGLEIEREFTGLPLDHTDRYGHGTAYTVIAKKEG